MKAIEAPEKIYLHIRPNKEIGSTWHGNKISDTDIEYTNIDAFIEKAENYLRNKCQRFILTEKDIEDFVKFMKGE